MIPPLIVGGGALREHLAAAGVHFLNSNNLPVRDVVWVVIGRTNNF